MIDLGRALKSAMTTGKVVFGVEQTEKTVRNGEAKLVIVAKNCPSGTELSPALEYGHQPPVVDVSSRDDDPDPKSR